MSGEGGLLNMGLTCYANAVMQAFRHCKQVPWLFESGRYDTLLEKDPSEARAKQQALTKNFAEIVQLLQKCARGQTVRPGAFWKAFARVVEGTGFEELAIKMPHDSHEFYLCLLDTLHESLAKKVDMRILRPPPKTDAEKRCWGALETWRGEFQKKYSPLVDLFYGLTHITVECTECKNVTHRWETFSALKAEFPGDKSQPPTLFEMLAEEMGQSEIEGYHCEKCEPKRTTAIRSTKIWRLPIYIVVVLKRFTPTGRKLGTPLAALSNPSETVSFEPFFSSESPERVAGMNYMLHSIVDHHGSGAGGHYTAQCKSATDGKWRVYDDEGVSEIPAPMFGSSSYMLWFERRRP